MTKQLKRQSNQRVRSGAQLVEFPVIIGIVIVVILFTLIDLATVMIGVNNIHNATRIAATDGARGANFSEIDSRARQKIAALATTGVTITTIEVSVFEVPISESIPDPDNAGKALSLETKKILPGPPPAFVNTSQYQYQVEVKVDALATPLINLTGLGRIAGVPGLTAPLPVTATYSSYLEHPKGLVGS